MPAAGEKNAFFGGKLKKFSVVTVFRNRHYTLTAVSVSHTLTHLVPHAAGGTPPRLPGRAFVELEIRFWQKSDSRKNQLTVWSDFVGREYSQTSLRSLPGCARSKWCPE